jgi:hypothetical protein
MLAYKDTSFEEMFPQIGPHVCTYCPKVFYYESVELLLEGEL